MSDEKDTESKEKKEPESPPKTKDIVEFEVVKEPEEPVKHESKEEKGTLKPEPEELKGLRGKLRKKDGEIKALKKERDELKDKYLRRLAEMENTRKRFEREMNDYYQYALSDFLKELLVVLDNFERALENKDATDRKSFQEGVELICRQYMDLLKKIGVAPMEIPDKRFDPNVQQAVMTEESEDVQEPEVAEELQKGYFLHDRLLRPALVKVRIPKKSE